MKTKKYSLLSRSRQSGATLIVALLLLLVMTVLGITTMQMTRMEERMAGNSRDINLAFQGAEAGLRDAETRIEANLTRPITLCPSMPCTTIYDTDVLPLSMRDLTVAWWQANTTEFGVPSVQEVTEVTREPYVATEQLAWLSNSLLVDDPSGRAFYRVTASSAGASATAEAVLESTYTKIY